jgi:tRNA-Thr(GGU) m(6)t(6)A37 methyltransferase TsaA
MGFPAFPAAERRENTIGLDRALRFFKGVSLTENANTYSLTPIGFVQSSLRNRSGAPRQGNEGAPDAWIEIEPNVAEALEGVRVGDEIVLITWLHQARREVLKVHPRGCKDLALAGVFATRSPDRPNPLGLHRVTVREINGNKLKVGPLEAIDGTPVLDIKPVLPDSANS